MKKKTHQSILQASKKYKQKFKQKNVLIPIEYVETLKKNLKKRGMSLNGLVINFLKDNGYFE